MMLPEDQSRSAIAAQQIERLRQLVLDAAQRNAFWQQHWSAVGLNSAALAAIEPSQLLSRLPFVTKADLVADQAAHPPYGSNLSAPVGSYSRLHQTSGTTTGVPMRWLDTPASWEWIMGSWQQLFRIAGFRDDDRLFFPFSFGPFLGFWAGFEGASRSGKLCIAGGGMTSSARLKMLRDNSATVVCCTPTYALRLAEIAAEEQFDLRASTVRLLLVAGEPGGSIGSIRERIESAWNARVIDHWGMTELGPLAIECEASPNGMHILETECIAEIIDPQSSTPAQPDPTGAVTGELVITNLGRTGSPLIRYRTGDLVTTDPQPCACGRNLMRLKGGILSRVDDMLIIRGNNVFPSSIEAILREYPEIAEYRLQVRTERAMTHLKIELEPVGNLSDADQAQLASRVDETIKARLNFHPEIALVPSGSLPRFELKGKRLVRE